MNCRSQWSYERYRQPVNGGDDIYISRIAPDRTQIALDFFGKQSEEYDVFFRKMGSGDSWSIIKNDSCRVVLSGLEEGEEYEFYVSSPSAISKTGIARTGFVPGTVVNYLNPGDSKYAFSGQYLCTPSLMKHPDGYLLASMDVFEKNAPQNLTLIFRSDDNGESWYHYSELFPCFWGKLFLHRNEVYMLATSTEYGDLLIGKSSDGGKTWAEPSVLLRGSGCPRVPGWHKSAMPIIEYRGRLWTAIDYGAWNAGGHASALLSVCADSDLLRSENWSITEPLPYDSAWKGSVEGDNRGFLEGNAVVLPDGGIGNILRYTTDKGTPNHGLIPVLRGDTKDPDKVLTFAKYVPFQGNLSKFDILLDDVSGYYYSIICRIYDEKIPYARNLLSLVRTVDLEHWELVCDILDYTMDDPKTVGFQYVSFLFDGDDILFLSRTAFNGAKSYHDNNYITFHRITNFRKIVHS